MNKWTMSNKIGVLVAQGLVVPIFFKNVPNFINVPRVPKSVLRLGTSLITSHGSPSE